MPRILFDTRERHFSQNPYISDLVASVPTSQIDGFSWGRALLGRYDVVHIHWPEWMVKHHKPVVGLVMQFLTALAILRWRVTRTPIVRTVHNRAPHSKLSPSGALLVRAIERQSNRRIWLSVLDDQTDHFGPNDTVIPHPDYEPLRQRLGVSTSAPPTEQTALCFGSLTRYRRFEEVAQAASGATGSLTIAGAASEPAYAEKLDAIAESSAGNVTVRRGRLSDAELVTAIQASRVVFVPYEDLYNSGVIFLSLTMQRPVALRAGAMADRLTAEYGRSWIRTWDGQLTSPQFDEILSAPHPNTAAHSPDREWASVGRAHQAIYEATTARTSPRAH